MISKLIDQVREKMIMLSIASWGIPVSSFTYKVHIQNIIL